MSSKKQLATAIVDTTEEVKSENENKLQQMCDKCDLVLDKIKIKKDKRNKTLIEIK